MKDNERLRNVIFTCLALLSGVIYLYDMARCVTNNLWDLRGLIVIGVFALMTGLAIAITQEDILSGIHGFTAVAIITILLYMASNVLQNKTLFMPIDFGLR